MSHYPASCSPSSMCLTSASSLPLQTNVAEISLHGYDVDSNLQLLTCKDGQTVPDHTLHLQPEEDAPAVISHVQWQDPLPLEESHCNSHDDLDETLTGSSIALAGTVDFNDEEEWHSFSQDSTSATQVRDGLDFSDSELLV